MESTYSQVTLGTKSTKTTKCTTTDLTLSRTRATKSTGAILDWAPDFVPPVQARNLTAPRSPPCKSSVKALKLYTLASEPDLKTWKVPDRDNVFLVTKAKFQDPQAQRAHAARNVKMAQPEYKDPDLYQYGILPDQHLPRNKGQLHAVDWLDPYNPASLVAQRKQQRGKQVPPWDGTHKKITDDMLWRKNNPVS
mmetsp:Transcript_2189/g.3244  ORF Transcript_2189/g.3244 Transcript_2189/m.3244 type:complete len:194 (-) Transcript_2189:297-878(-)